MFPWLIRIILRAVIVEGSQDAKVGIPLIELLKVIIAALGPILAALIAATAGAWIAHRYASKREAAESAAISDRHEKDLEALEKRHDLDKESEWRSHAVELTKLEVQRKLAVWQASEPEKRHTLRPVILDFLANYRDLIELDESTPRDLYLKIFSDRISQLSKEDRETLTTAEIKALQKEQLAKRSKEMGNLAPADATEELEPETVSSPQIVKPAEEH